MQEMLDKAKQGDDHAKGGAHGDAEHEADSHEEAAGDSDKGQSPDAGDSDGGSSHDIAAGDGSAKKGTSAATAQGAQGGAGIRPGVKLTPAISSNFAILRPYLPAGVVMTSGLRSDADQTALINRYYLQKGGNRSVTDIGRRLQWLRGKGMKIAAPGTSPHRTGKAFDLSGAALSSIVRSVLKCKTEKKDFKYTHHLLETANNCVHVEVSG